jgi:hypothetical protein
MIRDGSRAINAPLSANHRGRNIAHCVHAAERAVGAEYWWSDYAAVKISETFSLSIRSDTGRLNVYVDGSPNQRTSRFENGKIIDVESWGPDGRPIASWKYRVYPAPFDDIRDVLFPHWFPVLLTGQPWRDPI